jgi:hypothetical protein
MQIGGKQYLPYLFMALRDKSVVIQDVKITLNSSDIKICQNKTLDLFADFNVKYSFISLDLGMLSFDAPDISKHLNGMEYKGVSLGFVGIKGFQLTYANNVITLKPISDLIINVPFLRHFVKQKCDRIEIYENGTGKIINSNRGIDITPDISLEFV